RPELPERRVSVPGPGDDASVPVLHLERRLPGPSLIRHLSRLERRPQLAFFVAVEGGQHDELCGCGHGGLPSSATFAPSIGSSNGPGLSADQGCYTISRQQSLDPPFLDR